MKSQRHSFDRRQKSTLKLEDHRVYFGKIVDPLLFSAVRIRAFYNDLHLSDATGFFYSIMDNGVPGIRLVTNWHVLSGRNAEDPTLTNDPNGSVPNKIRLRLLINKNQREYSMGKDKTLYFEDATIDLYDDHGHAGWYQHHMKNLYDVAAISIENPMSRYDIFCINEVANNYDMAIDIGNDIFILGYPLGFSHFADTAVWKKGTIASDPHLEDLTSRSRVLVDATTRSGMSGSPVIMRTKTHYITEEGNIKKYANATRFIGIYSSRPNISTPTNMIYDDRRAEVGYFCKSGSIDQTLNGIAGPNYGELP